MEVDEGLMQVDLANMSKHPHTASSRIRGANQRGSTSGGAEAELDPD